MYHKLCNIYHSENERSRLVKVNILTGALIRCLSIIASFILVPLTINYISSELYGIWLTLSSVIQWIGFFDIGFGNGLRNRLGESLALGKYKKGRIIVSTTYALLTMIFFSLGFILFFAAESVNWSSFLNVSQEYNTILVTVAQILIISVSIQMVLKLVQNVIQAYQLTALASLIEAVGNILTLLFVYLLTIFLAPELTNIALVFCIVPIVTFLMASLMLYSSKFKNVSPTIKYVRLKYAKDIFNLGSEFFIVQIAALVLYQMINILISRLCGPEDVTCYNIAYKYFSVLMMGVTIILAPIWSAFTDAYVKNDAQWMNHIYRKLLKMFVFFSLAIILMLILSPLSYHLWIGDQVQVTYITSLLVAIYMIIGIWGQIHSAILNGMGKIRFQVYYSVVIMSLFIPLALLLGTLFKMPGILLSMILVNAPGIYFGRYQVVKLINRTATGIWIK